MVQNVVLPLPAASTGHPASLFEQNLALGIRPKIVHWLQRLIPEQVRPWNTFVHLATSTAAGGVGNDNPQSQTAGTGRVLAML